MSRPGNPALPALADLPKAAGFSQAADLPQATDLPQVEVVELLISDCSGVFRGKRVTRDSLDKIGRSGMLMPGSLFASDITGTTVDGVSLGWDDGDADRLCKPIPGTFKPVPWLDQNIGQMLFTMHEHDGRPFFADPRQVLRRVAERFAEMGLVPVIAAEMEFYLLDARPDDAGRPQPPRSVTTGARHKDTQVYAIDDLQDYDAVLGDIIRAAAAQDIPANTIVAEYAPAQYEVNLLHGNDVLAAGDHAILLKRLVKGVARSHGMDATFMAKPYAEHAGNGMHVHVSLLDESGRNVFAGEGDQELSETLRHGIGGLMETMAQSCALFLPNANSYRRMQPDSYAPLAPCWGMNNRTTAVRIPPGDAAATRIEHRAPSADANPYLVLAAVLAGIHHGITHEIDPGPATTGNSYDKHEPSLPATWGDALAAFEKGEILRDYLGAEFCALYSACKRTERDKFRREISSLEYEWYLRTV